MALILPLFVFAASGSSFWSNASAQDASPTPGVLSSPAANIDCSTAPANTTDYAVASDKSAVRYKAEEELASKGANTAVGETNAFIGNIYFDASGVPVACSRWDADLRTLKSDESRRDNFLYNNTLETQTYPLATFILTSVEGLNGPLTNEDTTFTLIGDLTIHGVTKSVSWHATAKLDGDTVTGTATTSFNMPDFNIQPPKVGPVISLDEHVVLEVDISATKAA
jgi:polyisoprenoid-binding protein YceI